MFLERGIFIPSPNLKAGVQPFVRHLRLLNQYTGIYPPYLEVLSSICDTSCHGDRYTQIKYRWIPTQ